MTADEDKLARSLDIGPLHDDPPDLGELPTEQRTFAARCQRLHTLTRPYPMSPAALMSALDMMGLLPRAEETPVGDLPLPAPGVRAPQGAPASERKDFPDRREEKSVITQACRIKAPVEPAGLIMGELGEGFDEKTAIMRACPIAPPAEPAEPVTVTLDRAEPPLAPAEPITEEGMEPSGDEGLLAETSEDQTVQAASSIQPPPLEPALSRKLRASIPILDPSKYVMALTDNELSDPFAAVPARRRARVRHRVRWTVVGLALVFSAVLAAHLLRERRPTEPPQPQPLTAIASTVEVEPPEISVTPAPDNRIMETPSAAEPEPNEPPAAPFVPKVRLGTPRFSKTDKGWLIKIPASRKPRLQVFELRNPQRIVVTLFHSTYRGESFPLTSNIPYLALIRVGQRKTPPGWCWR